MSPILRLPSALIAATMLCTAAAGQDARGSVDQVGGASAGEVEQIAPRAPALLAPPSAPREAAPPAQLSEADRSASPQPQLTTERRSARATPQLYRGGRTAESSEPLSRPAEGRTGAVERVAGADRCDPREGEDAQRASCRRVIETRSAEFDRPAPPALSAEQRLLIEQRAREARMSSRRAARRLAEDADAASPETQGIASLVLRPSPGPDDRPADETDLRAADAAAIVNAIINGGSPASPPPQ